MGANDEKAIFTNYELLNKLGQFVGGAAKNIFVLNEMSAGVSLGFSIMALLIVAAEYPEWHRGFIASSGMLGNDDEMQKMIEGIGKVVTHSIFPISFINMDDPPQPEGAPDYTDE